MAVIGTRPLTPEDEPLLWDMLHLAIYTPDGSLAPRELLEKPELKRYVEGWGQPDDRGFAAVILGGGEAVGAAWIRLLKSENPGYGYIDDLTPELTIAIRHEWRGQGVGSFMLRELLDEARLHYPAISLSVTQRNPAKALYERLGWRLVTQSGEAVTMVRACDAEPIWAADEET